MHSPCGSNDQPINLFCSERQLVNRLLGIEKYLWEAIVRIPADPHGRKLIFIAVPNYFNGEGDAHSKSKLCLYLIPLSSWTGSHHGRERRHGRAMPMEQKTNRRRVLERPLRDGLHSGCLTEEWGRGSSVYWTDGGTFCLYSILVPSFLSLWLIWSPSFLQLFQSRLWDCVVIPSFSYSNRLSSSLPKGVRGIHWFLMRSRWFLEILLMRLHSVNPPGPLQGSYSLHPESGPWES